MIEIRNLVKVYGSGPTAFRALNGVDFDVASREVVILAGPSGSGKTTLLSIMGGILAPTSGSVKINGQEIAGLKEKHLPKLRLKNIGFIFQGFNLFPALTAVENVEIALELHGKKDRKLARRLLEQVDLGDKVNSYPADLSGGQKQRVAIARALAGDPPIVLADEPTASLDSTTGKMVVELMTGLAREQGHAVVIVTHDPRVMPYGDRVVHIADGKIQQEDSELAEVHE